MRTNVSPTSVEISEFDWQAVESLLGPMLKHSKTIKVRFGEADLLAVGQIVNTYVADHPGLRPSMGDAVRLALHWAAEKELPLARGSVSQLLRDVLAAYAENLASA